MTCQGAAFQRIFFGQSPRGQRILSAHSLFLAVVHMRVFVSYASEQRDIAESVALALRNVARDVFFDRDAQPAGDEFDANIRRAILRSDLFLFLASRDSLRPGGYPLTELGIAERKWRRPTGKVLPILVDDTPIEALPAYLRAVSMLQPRGNLVAEVVDAVARLRTQRRRIFGYWALVSGMAIAVAVAGLVWMLRQHAVTSENPLESDGSTRGETSRLEMNSHVFGLANLHHVRLVGKILENSSNVADVVLRHEIEWDAWMYNRCYDTYFGHLKETMPTGTVVIAFDIFDQLPQGARIESSGFLDDSFNRCVLGTLEDKTLNRAGSNGAGHVRYAFEFKPD